MVSRDGEEEEEEADKETHRLLSQSTPRRPVNVSLLKAWPSDGLHNVHGYTTEGRHDRCMQKVTP